MGLKDRLKRLEGKAPSKECRTCGGKIIIGEEQENGTVVWDGDGPCGECGSRPTQSGHVARIFVVYDGVVDGGDPVWP